MRRVLLLAVGLALCLGWVAAGQQAVPNPDTLVVATFAGWDSFDPAWCYDTASGEALFQIYESLIAYDGTSMTLYRPILATRVPTSDNHLVKIAADGSATVRFDIRQGVPFQNGDIMTPADVVYSFQRNMLADPTAGPDWILLSQLVGKDTLNDLIDAVGADAAYDAVINSVYIPADDPNAVEFKLPKYTPFFFQTIADSASWAFIVDKKWCIAQGAWDGKKDDWQKWHDQPKEEMALYTKANGTGPFMLEGTPDPVTGYTLVRFDNYHKGADFGGGPDPSPKPILKRVEVVYVEEWTTRKLMLENGTADIADIPRQYMAQVEGTKGVRTIYNLPGGNNNGFLLNLDIVTEGNDRLFSGKLDGEGIPPDFFMDLHARKGFGYAFDYQKYIDEVFMGEGTVPTGVIPSWLPGYSDQGQYTYDPEKAAAEFKLAYGGQLWDKGFKMRLDYNAGNVARQTGCEMLRDSLMKINPKFQIEVRGIPWANYLDDNRARRMTMFFIGWQFDYPDADNFVTPYYSSTGTYGGRGSFAKLGDVSKQLDTLLLQARFDTNAASRAAEYAQIQKIGYDNALNMMVVEPTGRRWMRTWVGGFWYHPSWSGLNFKTMYKATSASPDLALLGAYQYKMQEW